MLKGKAAIVTGSTSGIGLGIARALAEVRCNIMLNGFGEASVIEHERGKLATKFGVVKVSFNGADLSKPTEVSKMIEAATLELGQVDILVNNAGIQHTAPVEQFPIDHTSGRRRYLSAAQPVRRCVRTGAGELCGKARRQQADRIGDQRYAGRARSAFELHGPQELP
jgi:NAD(P)-dependent dehydrogenase (short-subunit alcohol dehydrogenase family)